MLKLTTLLFLTLLICSCSEEEKLIGFPPGEYISNCTVDGTDSKRSDFTISRDFKSQIVQTFVYAGVSNCSGNGVPESEPIESAVILVFSNEDLGGGASYLTSTFEEDGLETTEFIAFKFENSTLYFSPSVTSIGEDPKLTFADFVQQPEFIANIIFTRKDLNRPLSRK